jgi:hypothetical protein
LQPLITEAVKLFGNGILCDIDNHIKSALLLRLLGGQDVSRMTPQDQVKMIGLIYKSIGTPEENDGSSQAIDRFMNAI